MDQESPKLAPKRTQSKKKSVKKEQNKYEINILPSEGNQFNTTDLNMITCQQNNNFMLNPNFENQTNKDTLHSNSQIDNTFMPSSRMNKEEAILSNEVLDQSQTTPPTINKRRRYFIGIAVIFALTLLITGGVLLGLYLNQTDKSFVPTIKIPENYHEYKQLIKKGQENNLVELIYIPKSQKIYEYNIYHTQSTTQQDGKSKKSTSKITHRLGVVCTGISEKQFNMMLYFMNTTTYENGNKISYMSGFPEMLSKENKNLRILSDDDTDFTILQENKVDPELTMSEAERRQEEAFLNQYAPLNDQEKEMLAKKGITEKEFNFSRYPIIKFDISKDGSILEIQVPINLRYDLQQVYINILEQISPVVSQNLYNIYSQDGKRLLRERKDEFKQRILSGEVINKDLNAYKDENGDANISQKYNQVVKPSETSFQNTNYVQNSQIQSGALLESKVDSALLMKDNKNSAEEDEQDGLPIMKNIDAQSQGNIRFLKQEDTIEQGFYNTIVDIQKSMSYMIFTHDEAIKAYNKQFGSQSDQGEPVVIDPEDNINNDYNKESQKRILQGDRQTDMFPAVTRTLFKKSFASIELGAELRSSCYKWESGLTQDECVIGLYSFFNGESIKIAERYTKLNVSKIQKYTNYIQNLVQDQLNGIKNDMIISLNKIKGDLNNLVDRYHDIFDPTKNQLLKLFKINDALNSKNIYVMINTFDNQLNRAILASNTLVDYQFQSLTTTATNFIAQKYESLSGSFEQISSYYNNLLQSIQLTLTQMENSSQSLNPSDYNDLKDLLESISDTIEDQLNSLINEPINRMISEFEDFIQEESNKAYGDTDVIIKSIEISKNSDADQLKRSNLMKRILTAQQFIDKLQKFISQTLSKTNAIKVSTQKISSDLNSQIKNSIQSILNILNRLQRNGTSRSATISAILINNQVFEFSSDLQLGFSDIKQQISQIYQTITLIQAKQTSKLFEFVANKISNFPYDLQEIINTQTNKSVQSIQEISSNMNIFFQKWTEDLTTHSSRLLTDSQNLYKEIKRILADNSWPNTSPNFSKKLTNQNTDPLTQAIQRQIDNSSSDIKSYGEQLNSLHTKFEDFLQSMKNFGQNSYKYISNIDIKFSNSWVDKANLWKNLSKIAVDQASSSNILLSTTVQNEFEVKLKFTTFKNQSIKITTTDITSYKTQLTSDNNFTTSDTNRRAEEILKSGDTNEKKSKEIAKIEKTYQKAYPTPIGILLTMKIYAAWSADIFFEQDVKRGVVDISFGIQTRVQLNGEVGASAYVAEVGGYCEGTFLDSEIRLGIKLKPLDNFKGSVYLSGKFKPYYIKFGLYYKTILQVEGLSCDYSRRRVLWDIGGAIKSAANTVYDAGKTAVNEVKKVAKCITTFKPKLTRNDIVEPLVIDGPTYEKVLFEQSF